MLGFYTSHKQCTFRAEILVMAGDLEIFRDCHSLPLRIETGKTSLVVQWLGPYAFTARGSIPGWETKILHAAQCGQKGER